MILHAALLYVIQEAELLEGLLPDTDDVVLGLADGVASRSVISWRILPTVSGEMDSFSVSTRNAEINDVSCWMSIIIFADFQFSAKVE